jgi:hypothetical protein
MTFYLPTLNYPTTNTPKRKTMKTTSATAIIVIHDFMVIQFLIRNILPVIFRHHTSDFSQCFYFFLLLFLTAIHIQFYNWNEFGVFIMSKPTPEIEPMALGIVFKALQVNCYNNC